MAKIMTFSTRAQKARAQKEPAKRIKKTILKIMYAHLSQMNTIFFFN